MTTDTNIYGSHYPWVLPVINFLMGSPKKLIDGIYPTVIGFYACILYILNITTAE